MLVASSKSEVLISPTLGLINLLEQHTELRETHGLLKDILRVQINSQIKEIHRTRSGGFLSIDASVPMKGASPSWYTDLFINLETLQTPNFRDLVEASSYKHGQSLKPFSGPLSSQEYGERGRVENSKLLIMHDLVFPVTNPHLGARPESPH